jgi:hypothetical protein
MSFSWSCLVTQGASFLAVQGAVLPAPARDVLEAHCPCDEHAALRALVWLANPYPRSLRAIAHDLGIAEDAVLAHERTALRKLRATATRMGLETFADEAAE